MIPLLWDALFASMAVTIMAGLGFATILTLIGVPVFYQTYFRRERQAEAQRQTDQGLSSNALPLRAAAD